jgi:putative phage-type endonuclease
MIEQNTQEWLEMRKNHIGASDAPIVMGISPYKTPYRLWQEKLGIIEPEPENVAQAEGKRKEPIARKVLEEELQMPLFPKVLTHRQRSWMMASLDAISFDERTVAEIKCPGKEDHEIAVCGHVPEKYFPQLQHQIEVCELDYAYYFSFDGGKGVVVKVFRDEKYIKEMIAAEEKFFACVQNFDAPPLTNRDYQIQNMSEWASLAMRWKELESLDQEKEEIRKQLIALCNGQSSMGDGIKVAKCLRKGNVDYSKIPELQGLDLDVYRKKSSEYWRVMVN